MGGGFGGKDTQSGHLAVWAALAAHKTGRPVKMRLSREDDFLVTGKRHPFSHDYQAGFDAQGRLLALQNTQWAHCGFSADLSGMVLKHFGEGKVGGKVKHVQSYVVTAEICKLGMSRTLTLR